MKLRNKKTGEIETACPIYVQNCGEYSSLAELNEEWEDYEEPKEYWYIRYDGCITITCGGADDDMKQIGNYFETKEEAEKAVEKLKAWKRLKDKGFKPVICKQGQYLYFEACWGSNYDGKMNDLDLLFGGEE